MDKLYNLTQPLLVKIPLVFSSRGAVVAAFFLIVFAKTVQVQLQYILTPKTGYNNVNPREARGDEKSWQVQAIQRARNSQDNSWEAFIMFTAAMLLAFTSKTPIDATELQFLANAFIFVRIAYIISYVLAFNAPLSGIRSAIWLTGVGIVLRIFSLSVGSIWA
jgi:uncharacterized MAPEG superfamily protein